MPIRLDIATKSGRGCRTLHNGDEVETTTSASVGNGAVSLKFEHYLTTISANMKDELDPQVTVTYRSPINITPGSYQPTASDRVRDLHAKRYVALTQAEASNVPSIDSVWEVPHESRKGEKAWRLIVKQKGSEIETTILRVDGDTGALTGGWQNDRFVASHFDVLGPA